MEAQVQLGQSVNAVVASDPTLRQHDWRPGMTDKDKALHITEPVANQIAIMSLRRGSPRTTVATEQNLLLWDSDQAGSVKMILESPEWDLWLRVIKGWKNPPGTSEKSCLLPAYEGFTEGKVCGQQQPGTPPVSVSDEHAAAARLEWFGGGEDTPGAHRVLRVSTTGTNRVFTVGLSWPDNPKRPLQGRHAAVSCDGGLTASEMALYRMLWYEGPEMPEADPHPKDGGPPITAPYRKDVGDWLPQMDRGIARRIFLGHEGDANATAKQTAIGEIRSVPVPRMLQRRKWQNMQSVRIT